MTDEIILKKLEIMCKKAIKNNDVPVSCIIINNRNEIIASDYNKRVKNNDPMAHAEILAIKKASKKLSTYNLIDCKMYVTLKPCKMCEEIIKISKIKEVYYILENKKQINNKINYKKILLNDSNIYKKYMINFFKNIRIK